MNRSSEATDSTPQPASTGSAVDQIGVLGRFQLLEQVGVGAFRAFDGNGHHLAVLGIDQLAGRRRKARVGLELFFDGLHGEVGAF